MKKPKIKFTELATGFAKAKSSMAEVEAQVGDLIFHTFKVGGTEFIAYPKDGEIEIDTCSREDDIVLDKGPFKGKRVVLPRPDSENR